MDKIKKMFENEEEFTLFLNQVNSVLFYLSNVRL